MQKNVVMVLSLVVLFVLLYCILDGLHDLKDKLYYLRLSSHDFKTVQCEDFKAQVDMLRHPCGKTVVDTSESSLIVNVKTDERSVDRIQSFERIYENFVWRNYGESKSGLGSTKNETRKILKILNKVVDFLKTELKQERIR